MTDDLSIVVVSWNTRSYLGGALASLFEQRIQTPLDIVVVDNGSTDASLEMVRSRFPTVRLIENTENVGFAKATNQGAVATTGRFILLLNADTLVDGRSIDAMFKFMEATPDAAAVGGKLLYPDGSLQAGYASFSNLFQELLISLRFAGHIWPGYPSHRHSKNISSVDWLSGACLMVRRSAFFEVGCLNEAYFSYSEEVDLQFRLKMAGWKIYYLPYVHTIHYGGGSLDRWRRRKLVYRGKILFYRNHYSRVKEWSLRVMLGLISFCKMLMWAPGCLAPVLLKRARRELRSNWEVLKLCIKVEEPVSLLSCAMSISSRSGIKDDLVSL